jgi:GTP-binding protein Era
MNQKMTCGQVAIIGRPNVGKSTLLNCLIGKKISITSPKPQTTRHQILGIKTIGNAQIVYMDTPGLHEAKSRAINRYLNRLASSVIMDADIVVFMIDAERLHKEDDKIIEKLSDTKAPVILVINKADRIKDKAQLLPLMEKLKEKYHFAHIVPLSALKKDNVELLQTLIMGMLPEGIHLFPDDQITDKNERFQAAEIIREKLIQATQQEIPYSTAVTLESFEKKEKLLDIHAIIWVEREGQKPIVIGQNGALLKKIGTQARKEMEHLFNQKVFLRLWVKVKNDWPDSEQSLQNLGYE